MNGTGNRKIQAYVLWAIDTLLILAAYYLSTYRRFGNIAPYSYHDLHRQVLVFSLLFCCVYNFFLDWNHDFLTRGYFKELTQVLGFNASMFLTMLLYMYAVHISTMVSRLLIARFLIYSTIFMFAGHVVVKVIMRRTLSADKYVRKIFIVAQRELLPQTIERLSRSLDVTAQIVGAAYARKDEEASDTEETVSGIPVASGIRNLTEFMTTRPFDEVFINTPDLPQRSMRSMIRGFEDMGVVCHYSLELPDVGARVTSVENFGDYSVITYRKTLISQKKLAVKRLIDIIGGIVGLILTGIITVFLAPAIKKDSPGPVFYSQVRVGKNGRRFRIYKFRSMYVDADERLKDLQSKNEMSGLMFKIEDDPRITKVGKFIRKTSLDEFPQFLNVLKGDMSLVGTRPPTEAEFEQYNEHYRRRISMTPGLTGLWQVSGRSEITDFDEIVRLDLQYIDNWSLSLDFRIILKTIKIVFKGEGAE